MAFLQTALVILIAFGILFGAHYALYISAVRLFAITSPAIKAALFIALAALAVSFPFAMAFSQLRGDLVTRAAYFISTFWLGILTNMILAAAAIWVIVLLARIMRLNAPTPFLAAAGLVLALTYSVYGVWNALHPRVKEITVPIPGLPDVWRGKKIVQLSDLHLGHIFCDGFLDEVAEAVEGAHPDLIVVTGDLFDSMEGRDLSAYIDRIDMLQAPHGTYFITGNHETYVGVDKVRTTLSGTHIRILEDQVVDIEGLKIIGLSYPERSSSKDVAATLKKLESEYEGKANVLLYHAPTDIETFKKAGVNLQLSGHTHRGQIFPFRYITALIYKGYDYGLHTEGSYSIYTTSGTGSWGPLMRTGNRPEVVVITLE